MFLTGTGGGTGGSVSMILMLLLFFVLMWFFMIRPEKKKQKKVEAMRNALSVGDEIITIGGVMGTIVHITEDDITIETSEDKVRVQFKKWAVSTNVRAEAAEAKEKK
ncbi:MAG: preprotein translocase subunit YajC [Oscillospiraceae bacterium]|jgi:preprotein translocase, yajC subunit|nr:preprotein translocase subunit YajC [Oscillospiraceae bacterium]